MGVPGPDPESVWRAPLVPVALAVTAGVVLDHYLAVYLAVSLSLSVLALLGWCVLRREAAGLVCLGLVCAGCGAADGPGQPRRARPVRPLARPRRAVAAGGAPAAGGADAAGERLADGAGRLAGGAARPRPAGPGRGAARRDVRPGDGPPFGRGL